MNKNNTKKIQDSRCGVKIKCYQHKYIKRRKVTFSYGLLHMDTPV